MDEEEQTMTAEIITIGDELLIGQVINTNQAYIAEQLNGIGMYVERMTTIGDNERDILDAFGQQGFKLDFNHGAGVTHGQWLVAACTSAFQVLATGVTTSRASTVCRTS